jgi:hypothetical protein
VSKFQHHIKLYPRCSILLVSSSVPSYISNMKFVTKYLESNSNYVHSQGQPATYQQNILRVPLEKVFSPSTYAFRSQHQCTNAVRHLIYTPVKGKGHPMTDHQGPTGGSRGVALLILDLGARREWVVSTTPRPFSSQERPGTHCTGDWVGLRAGLDV